MQAAAGGAVRPDGSKYQHDHRTFLFCVISVKVFLPELHPASGLAGPPLVPAGLQQLNKSQTQLALSRIHFLQFGLRSQGGEGL